MANTILIMGESGTGKSSSIRTLEPKETLIINVLDKPLPFRGYKASYTKLSQEGGNYCATDDYHKILRIIKGVPKSRPDIKNVIIDDFQYIMANEFMRRAIERGFDKFTEIAQHAWEILSACASCESDITYFILSHTENDSQGKVKCKTIGKMLDEKITLEGMFTVVLHSIVMENKYKFITQNDGVHIAKSPMGMFDLHLIDNDLSYIKNKLHEYETGVSHESL